MVSGYNLRRNQGKNGGKNFGNTSVVILNMIRQQPEITIQERAKLLSMTRCTKSSPQQSDTGLNQGDE